MSRVSRRPFRGLDGRSYVRLGRRARARWRRAPRAAARWYAGLSFARQLALFPRLTAAALALVLLVTVGFGLAGDRRLARLGNTYYPRVERTWRLDQTLAALQRSLQDAATTGDADFLTRADSLAGAFSTTAGADAPLRRQFDRYYAAGRALTARVRAGEVGDGMAAALADFHARHAALRGALDAAARADRGAMVRAFAAERARTRVAWGASLTITVAFVGAVMALARLATRDLTHRAYHDPLTGLPNRARFQDRVAEALLRAARAGGLPGSAGPPDEPARAAGGTTAGAAGVAVLLIDLDGFKLVNDTAGHAAGDALLQAVAGRLRNATRGCDLVARLGGDEFGVLLDNVRGEADAIAVAERVVAALARPITVHGTTAAVGASVGIARGGRRPAGAEHGASGPEAAAMGAAVSPGAALLRDADLALYEAKARGRGQWVVFEPGMHAAVVERLALEGALRRGLERGEFHLVYQPIVDLATGAPSGVEALVRWAHPTRGPVSPAQFIPLAEETGLIRPLGRWVLEEACRQGAAWTGRGGPATGGVAPDGAPFSVTVNVSGRQLQHAGFVAEVEAALAASGFPAERLVLELTESTVIHQPEVARQRLEALKALGVRLAIDDFGTGYSALSYLREFPIDVLKIDKSFVDGIAQGGQPAALAAAIVALGEALSLRTVAEGVESAAQAAALEGMGCPLAQGYHFSRPLPPAAVTAWLDSRADSRAAAPCPAHAELAPPRADGPRTYAAV